VSGVRARVKIDRIDRLRDGVKSSSITRQDIRVFAIGRLIARTSRKCLSMRLLTIGPLPEFCLARSVG